MRMILMSACTLKDYFPTNIYFDYWLIGTISHVQYDRVLCEHLCNHLLRYSFLPYR